MYEFECLTTMQKTNVSLEVCQPYYGECYPIGEDCCGPDCNPN